MRIGFHVSIAGGLHRAFERAERLGCTTFQIFTTNPRSWKGRKINPSEARTFLKAREKSPIDTYFSHLPYLANFCGEKTVRERSIGMLIQELERCKLLKIKGVVIHPGKTKGKVDYKEAIRLIASALDSALQEHPSARILIETTAGQGTEVGYRLEHIADIINGSRFPERLGICLDTAHLFQAGYPIHTEKGLEQFSKRLEKLLGHEKVELIHLNDSRTPFASKVDRHWHIGLGEIGEEGFRRILSHPTFRSKPLIMETPWGEEWDRRNMEKLKHLLGIFS